MALQIDLEEYLAEIRRHVCSRCVERPPGGPPCAPLGKPCGIELHLEGIIDAVHSAKSGSMRPYIERFHDQVCAFCENRGAENCPCPLEFLLPLTVEAIEAVDERHAERGIGDW